MTSAPDRTFVHRTSKDGEKPILISYVGNPAKVLASIKLTEKHYNDERRKALETLGMYVRQNPYGTTCTAKHCTHCVYRVENLTRHGDFALANGRRIVVACDPSHTNVVDDCVECFDLADGTRIVRTHLALPETLNCTSEADLGARVATMSAFIVISLRETTARYLFDRSHEGNYTKGGFVKGVARVALTVESVFDRVPSKERYRLNSDKSRLYLSRVTLTTRVTDEQLFQRLSPPTERGVTAEGAAAARQAGNDAHTRAALDVLTRIYKLAKDLGWASGALFQNCSTTLAYRTDANAAPLLRQRFNPDYHAVITMFCFRHLASQAVLHAARKYVQAHPQACLPLICRFPCGACLPRLTEWQAAVLRAQGYSNDCAAGAPTTERWRRVCGMATKRGVRLLQLFDDLGMPLKDSKGNTIRETSLRYTTNLEDDYHCYVISNKPMRDYTCLVNARCATCLLQSFDKALCVDAAVFGKWVAYWDTMQHRVAWSRRELTAGVLHCHMRRAFGVADAEVRGCVMEARVLRLQPDGGVVVVFPMMNRIQHTVPWKREYGKVPALGSPVLFSVRSQWVGCPDIRYIPNALRFAAQWKLCYVPELQKAQSS